MAHSEAVMICEIGDKSCVLNSHVDGGERAICALANYWACTMDTKGMEMRSTAGVQVTECLFAHCG